jgi:hypothetical protein
LFVLGSQMSPVTSLMAGPVTDMQLLMEVAAQAGIQRRMAGGRIKLSAGVPINPGPPPFGASAAPRQALSEAEARAWATDEVAEKRLWGIRALGKGAQNEQILREALWDPYYTLALSRRWEEDVGRRVWRVHPIRREAHGELWARNVHVDDTSMTPHPAYERLPWGMIGAVGLLVIGVVGWWGHRRCGMSWGRPGAVMAVVLGTICTLVLIGHWRSSRRQDTFNFAWRGFEWEMTSVGGRISVLRVESGAPSRGMTWWSVRRGEVDDDGKEWYSKMITPAKEGRAAGFEWARGDVVGLLKFHPYGMVRGPHWVVWAVVGAWPAWWAVTRGVRGWRRWKWGRAGRCLACGYDLRGSVGRRCSECGEVGGLVNAVRKETSELVGSQ